VQYPTDPALEAAVIARADEDTPRLAYADWLDDHGDPVRAEWIRVQCRLADLTPAASDFLDLSERQNELACLLKHRHLTRVGDQYHRFYFGASLLSRYKEPFRRGFPYFIDCQTSGTEWTAEEVQRVARDLAQLMSETTVRGFHPYSIPEERLAQLLAAPVCARLRGLEITPTFEGNWRERLGGFCAALGANEHLRGTEHLFLHSALSEPAVRALARATAFDAVRRLEVGSPSAPDAALTKLGGAAWFRRLRHLRVNPTTESVALLAPLGTFNELHTLDLPSLPPSGASELAAGKWPALARLYFGGALTGAGAKALARAKFPVLVAFHHNGSATRNDELKEVLKGAWTERLRVLDLDSNRIGDAGVKALAAHPVARELRHLRLGDNAFGKGGLMALATGFPALTVLDLGPSRKRKASEADVAAFVAALSAPVRHLNLHGWPLGNAGAQALAANPALAGLTRLNADGCKIGNAGVHALLASPHLRNLVDLRIDGNDYTPAATNALADPTVLPNLGECWADGSERLRKSAATARPRLYLMV
jgi:uncharacterized protein (TIGR02996 family)